MNEASAENFPQRRIIKRTNAINENPPKGSSLASKAASVVLAGAALGGAAVAINETQSDVEHANAAGITSPEVSDDQHTLQVEEKAEEDIQLFDTVFHDLTPQQQQEARVWVQDFKTRIAAKPGYEKEHRMIPQQYKEIIHQTAEAYGISEEMLYGIIAIENGGEQT